MSHYRFLAPAALQGGDIAQTHEIAQLVKGRDTIDPREAAHNVVARAYTIAAHDPGYTARGVEQVAAEHGLEVVEANGAHGYLPGPEGATPAMRLVWQGRMGAVVAVAVTPHYCPDPAELRALTDQATTATRGGQEAMAQRDDLVRQALAAGMTHAQASASTGLTRGRINQIARGRR